MHTYPYYKYHPNISGEGRRELSLFIRPNKKLIVNEFYLNFQDRFEGELIFYPDHFGTDSFFLTDDIGQIYETECVDEELIKINTSQTNNYMGIFSEINAETSARNYEQILLAVIDECKDNNLEDIYKRRFALFAKKNIFTLNIRMNFLKHGEIILLKIRK